MAGQNITQVEDGALERRNLGERAAIAQQQSQQQWANYNRPTVNNPVNPTPEQQQPDYDAYAAQAEAERAEQERLLEEERRRAEEEQRRLEAQARMQAQQEYLDAMQKRWEAQDNILNKPEETPTPQSYSTPTENPQYSATDIVNMTGNPFGTSWIDRLAPVPALQNDVPPVQSPMDEWLNKTYPKYTGDENTMYGGRNVGLSQYQNQEDDLTPGKPNLEGETTYDLPPSDQAKQAGVTNAINEYNAPYTTFYDKLDGDPDLLAQYNELMARAKDLGLAQNDTEAQAYAINAMAPGMGLNASAIVEKAGVPDSYYQPGQGTTGYDTVANIINNTANYFDPNRYTDPMTEELLASLPPIDYKDPYAEQEAIDRYNRMAELARQIEADDEIADNEALRTIVTGQQIKDAVDSVTGTVSDSAEAISELGMLPYRLVGEGIKKGARYVSGVAGELGDLDAVQMEAVNLGYEPGTKEFQDYVNSHRKSKTNTNTPANVPNPLYTGTDNVLGSYINNTGTPVEELTDQDYRTLRGLYQDARRVEQQELVNAFLERDPRNTTPENLIQTYLNLTGDTAYADEMQKDYARFKGMGMNDRQISAELYRRMADHQNPMARATDTQGNLHYDFALAGSGMLPDEIAVPVVYEDGTGNEAFNELTSMNYYNDDGEILYEGNDGNYYYGVPQADGTVDYRVYKGEPASKAPKYTPEQILSMFVNPNAGQPGESTWRGLDAVFEGLTPEERKGMEELLAAFIRGGDINAIREGFDLELANMTEAEYNKFAQKFFDKMPALKALVDKGVIKESDIANFFFKSLPEGKGNPGTTSKPKGSYTGGGYYGGGGGGYYYPGYGGGRSRTYAPTAYASQARVDRNPVNPTGANQNQSRVYNIMKNWSF